MSENIPQERVHIKTEIWWLLERDSPAVYIGCNDTFTNDVWQAKRFKSFESAQEFVNSPMNYYGTDWQILDHVFYV